MWAYPARGEFDVGFIPGRDHEIPSLSLGNAEVGGAYRNPESPVKGREACPGSSDGPTGCFDARPTGRAGGLRGIAERQVVVHRHVDQFVSLRFQLNDGINCCGLARRFIVKY